MEKVFYVSKMVGSVEFHLNNYETGMEFVSAGTHEGWRYETDDEWNAEEMAGIHGGTVEYYERAEG